MYTSIWTPIVRSTIRKALEFGWSGNRIYGALPDWGLPSYHRETFLKVVRYEREFLRVGQATINADRLKRFPTNIMVEEEFPYTSNYRLHGRMTLYDPDTDEEFEQDISMYTDGNLGPAGWEEDFISRYQSDYEEQDLEVVSVGFTKVVHFPGRPY